MIKTFFFSRETKLTSSKVIDQIDIILKHIYILKNIVKQAKQYNNHNQQ